jgi:replicative DNA helicase
MLDIPPLSESRRIAWHQGGALDNRAQILDLPWAALCERFAARWFGADKLKAPAFSPAIYLEGVNHFEERKAGKLVREWDSPALSGEIQRLDCNARGWSLLVFDLEEPHGKPAGPQSAAAAGPLFTAERLDLLAYELRARGLAFIIYSTFTHSPESPRVRLVLRPNRVIECAEIQQARAGGVAEFGLYSDPTCKNPSRIFFVPSAPEGTPPERVYFEAAEGADVDLDALLRRAPAPKPAPAPLALPPAPGPRRSTPPIERARKYAAATPPAVEGQGGDQATFTLCAAIARGFDLSDEDALEALRDWNARCLPPWDEGELLRKIGNARGYGEEAIGGRLSAPLGDGARLSQPAAPAPRAPLGAEEPPPPENEFPGGKVLPMRWREPGEDEDEPAGPGAPSAEYVNARRATVAELRAQPAPPSPAADLEARAPLLRDSLRGALEIFVRRANGEERPIPLPWPGLADLLGGGLWPGAHVFTGATATGKSALALQLALCAARAGHPVLYVGLELDTAQIVARLLSQLLGEENGAMVPWAALYHGRDPKALDRAIGAAEELARLPIRVEEAPPGGWSASNLLLRVAALRAAHTEASAANTAPLIILDFLQLVGPEPDARREELRERIGRAAYAGREVARKHGAAVVMLSSVSRAAARELGLLGQQGQLGEGDPADLVGLGKESGDIEFSADSVLALAREPKTEDGPTLVHLAIAKQRAGPPAWFLLRFNGSWFEPAQGPDVEAVERNRATKANKRETAKAERFEGAVKAAEQAILRRLSKGPASARDLRAACDGSNAAKDKALVRLSESGRIVREGPSSGGQKAWILGDHTTDESDSEDERASD